MKTTLLRPCTALRLFAGLFFLFITAAATASPPTSNDWADNAATSIANVGDGDGKSIDSPILIASAEELAYFAQQVNAGGEELACDNGGGISGNAGGFTGCYFALSADIDLKGEKWEPIGNADKNPFKGHFDGKGHEVKGLLVKIENSSSNNVYAGLFGYVKDGTLQNLGIELSGEGIEVSPVSQNVFAGGIVGRIAGGTLRNCYVEGTGAIKITDAGGDAYAGGISGVVINGNFTHCYATVDVEALTSNTCNVGGIAGSLTGTPLSYTYAIGKVTATGGSIQQWYLRIY